MAESSDEQRGKIEDFDDVDVLNMSFSEMEIESCTFGDECKKPHTFDITQTRELLVYHKLDSLDTDVLKTLFRKVLSDKKMKHASSRSGPSICKFYNKGDCKNGDKCEFLHVCKHYIDGDCKFGSRGCKRYHDFESRHSRKILAVHNMGELGNEWQIRCVLQSNQALNLDSDKPDNDSILKTLVTCSAKSMATSPSPTTTYSSSQDFSSEKMEICGFNLRGKCYYGNMCNALHTALPYQWQYYDDKLLLWKNFPDSNNRDIEKKFCDHEEDTVTLKLVGHTVTSKLGFFGIDFRKMEGRTFFDTQVWKVRRLSTLSSVLAVSGHVFRTTWKWYWQDERDKWHCYDSGKAETTSEEIEQRFQTSTCTPSESTSGTKGHKFSAGSNSYTLNFDDVHELYQQNDEHGTKRNVRRRPAKYLNEKTMKQVFEDFKRNRQKTSSNSGTPSYPVPSNWSPIDLSEEFKIVELSEVSDHNEYSKVKAEFMTTMAGFKVKSVKRVQNPGLWEDYERQKSKITKKNSGQSPEERWLFHGTSKDIVEPICQQGFDWRLSGSKHGAVYGKGSYFAVEASYSHRYSSKAVQDCCKIFMAKVIVGSYVTGSSDTQRPPAKDPFDPLSPLHDSCVNIVMKPTIFVVFERSQAYPYYIIDYTN